MFTGRRDVEADRQVANTLADLILGGRLASVEVTDATGDDEVA
jgi:hypothetical protein